jgi:nitrite reductase/ring-hydroxylating ferredoxin subunit
MAFTKVANSGEIGLDQLRAVEAGGKKLVLVRTAKGLAALDRKCTHLGADLCKGKVEAGQIVCPWHGAHFDAKTGAACADAKILFLKMKVKPLGSYPVKEEGGAILVSV